MAHSSVDVVISQLQAFVVQSGVVPTPAALIAKGMEIVQKQCKDMLGSDKKQLLLMVFEKVAAGKDGVVGTSDDVLPPQVVEIVKMLLEKNLVGDMIDVISAAANGKFELQPAVQVAQGCFAACFAATNNKK